MTALGFIYCEYTSFSRFRFFVKIHTVCYWPCARLFFYHLSFSSLIIIISWGRIFLFFFCNVDEAKKKRKKTSLLSWVRQLKLDVALRLWLTPVAFFFPLSFLTSGT